MRPALLKLLKNRRGQSTIEYIFTFIFTVGIFMLFVRLGVNMSGGFLAHYATYMASRAYSVSDVGNTPANSDRNAASVARDFFGTFRLNDFGVPGASSDLEVIAPNFPGQRIEYTGVRYKFSLPMTGFAFMGGGVTLDLTSESFLGREPVRPDCKERVCAAMDQSGGCDFHATPYDNGC